ncbi:MAG: VOC family protein [Oscillospiraceae bacterium]
MGQKIIPNLWFNGNAAEAARFYTEIFEGGKLLKTDYYPQEGLLDFQKPLAGEVLTVEFELAGFKLIAINAGPEFSPNPSISFMVNFDPARSENAEKELDILWEKLLEGGSVLMPVGDYGFIGHYGWLQDKYGISWQLILMDYGDSPRPPIMPSLMFGGEHQNMAAPAIAYYTSFFAGAQEGGAYPYDKQTGPATAAALMYADFALENQWFAANDSAVEQSFTFNEGVSLMVECKDQEEIDFLWDRLSSAPENEQCGWCKDRFGVSWQVVPENMESLMSTPDAFAKMLQMKKIIISDFG